MLDVVSGVRQIAGQVHQLAILIHVEDVFYSYTQLFFRDVNSRFKGKDRPGSQSCVIVAGSVHVQSDVVAKSMNEIFSQRLAMQVFAMGVDVVVSHIVERIRAVPPQIVLA